MRCSYEPLPDRKQAIRTIHAALDGGANVIDTADCYTPSAVAAHHNEVLIADALSQWVGNRDALVIATKVGHVRTDRSLWERNGRPEHLRGACEGSLQALRVERIDLLQLHSPDPAVPFEDQIGALARLREEGKAASIGLCNIGRKQLAAAQAITPIATVQNRYSLYAREAEGVLHQCEAEHVLFLAWSPLDGLGGRDPPRAVARIAAARGVSTQRITLAWLLARSTSMLPLLGATRPETARDSLAAMDLSLDLGELADINSDLPGEAASLV
jgi:aryl-alcohol dehydrogenase-like predicted oxidoreductase